MNMPLGYFALIFSCCVFVGFIIGFLVCAEIFNGDDASEDDLAPVIVEKKRRANDEK